MAVSVLTFVNWRSTLVAIQGALSGTLTSAVSAEGYALLIGCTLGGVPGGATRRLLGWLVWTARGLEAEEVARTLPLGMGRSRVFGDE